MMTLFIRSSKYFRPLAHRPVKIFILIVSSFDELHSTRNCRFISVPGGNQLCSKTSCRTEI